MSFSVIVIVDFYGRETVHFNMSVDAFVCNERKKEVCRL